MKEYYEQLYAPKFNDLDEIHQLLKRYHLPKLTQEEMIWIRLYLNMTVSMWRHWVNNEYEAASPNGFTGKFYQTFKEGIILILLEKEMATHASILAWRIPQTEEPGGLQSMGSQRVGHNWAAKHTNSLQCLSENNSRGNTSLLILWGQHYPNTESRQRQHKKAVENISHEQTDKNPQENISKPNPKKIYEKSSQLTNWDLSQHWMSWWFDTQKNQLT